MILCPTCGFNSPLEMTFCGRCGTKLKQACLACQFDNPLDFTFCGRCGQALPADRPSPYTALNINPQPHSFTPPVEESLPSSGELLYSLQGERRTATALLADVTRSTDLFEQLGTEVWVAFMNRVFQIMEKEIYRFGGIVDQFRGDGLVAFFGTTSTHEDDPERAVLASLAIQRAFESFALDLSVSNDLVTKQPLELRIRVGIDTGEVIVTSIGDSRRHQEDTAMGEAVAMAARMEEAAEPGTVLVSENTYQLVATQFTWQALGEIMVQGVHHPIAVYRPLGLETTLQAGQTRPTFGLSTSLTGREKDLEMLKSHIDHLPTGQDGHIILITGERGIGKTFLISELYQDTLRRQALLAEVPQSDQTAPRHAFTWLNGRCRSYNQSWPYSMWRDLLRDWLGLHEIRTDDETRNRLRERVQQLWGDQASEYYPYFATFLSLPLEGAEADKIKFLDAEGLRQQFYRTFRSWIEALAQQHPLILTLGGFQWADATSMDLLEYCISLTNQAPILWLMTARLDRGSALWQLRYRLEAEYRQHFTVLSLPPLTEAQSQDMIAKLIGPNVLPEAMQSLLIKNAEGNPYYISELVRSLIERDVLVQDAETQHWRATHAVTSMALPDTLQNLILARIDSMPVGARRTLQMATVIGTVFWSNVLQNLVEDNGQLSKTLDMLQRAALIQERGLVPGLGMEYEFRSNLIRDAAYEKLLKGQRTRIHTQVAQCFELQYGADVSPHYYGMLAYHYRHAEERGKELFYTHLAARQADNVYANTEALALYTRALEVLNQLEMEAREESRRYTIQRQQFEIRYERRGLYYRIGDFEAGRADAQALLPLARQLNDDPVWLIDALLEQPGVANWINQDELQHGLSIVEEALSLAQKIGDRHREMRCLMVRSSQRFDLRDADALVYAERALELARQLNDQYYQARILVSMSRILSWTNEPERGMEYLKAAFPISQSLDDKLAEVELLSQIGFQFERMGHYHLALTEYFEPKLNLSREIGHRPLEAEGLVKCGEIYGIYLGDFEIGLDYIEQARQIWKGTSHERFPYLRTVQIRIMQGKFEEAAHVLASAQQTPSYDFDNGFLAGTYLATCKLYNTFDNADDYHHVLENSNKVYQIIAENPFITQQFEMAAAYEAAHAHLKLAQIYAGQEGESWHLNEGLSAAQRALAIYSRFGFTQIIECVSEAILYRYSQALVAHNRTIEAIDYLEQAYKEMTRKASLIPADSPFRDSYLTAIPLHRAITADYMAWQTALPTPGPKPDDPPPAK